ATSATIADQRDPNTSKRFASRFFGVPPEEVECVIEEYEKDTWASNREMPSAPSLPAVDLLKKALYAVDQEHPDEEIRYVYKNLTGVELEAGDWQEVLHKAMIRNELAYQINIMLRRPMTLDVVNSQLQRITSRVVS